MKKDDGGPAYPTGSSFYSGMTVRDVFAGQALAGPLGSKVSFDMIEKIIQDDDTKTPMLCTAKLSYAYGQAMVDEKRRLEGK